MRHATKITFALLVIPLVIPGLALAGSATLHWQANTEPDLAGYRIYYGTASRSYGAPISVDKNTTNYTLNNLTDGQTYYFALTAVDTSGNESGYSQEVSKSMPSSSGYIPLPASGPYGNMVYGGGGGPVPGGDTSHADYANFSFGGMAGDVVLEYEAWDIDTNWEVEILVNGHRVGYVPVSGNERWSGKDVIILPDGYVNDTSTNIVTFNNTYNPPWGWGVRNLAIR